MLLTTLLPLLWVLPLLPLSLSKQVALTDGVLAFFLLIALQYVITYLSARHKKINNLVKSEPTLLLYKGEMLKEVMIKERIAEDEIFAVLRKKGIGSMKEADAIVLETDGTLTVIKKVSSLNNEPFKNVQKPPGVDKAT